MLIDCDSHLFEPGDMWQRYADPGDRTGATDYEPEPEHQTPIDEFHQQGSPALPLAPSF